MWRPCRHGIELRCPLFRSIPPQGSLVIIILEQVEIRCLFAGRHGKQTVSNCLAFSQANPTKPAAVKIISMVPGFPEHDLRDAGRHSRSDAQCLMHAVRVTSREGQHLGRFFGSPNSGKRVGERRQLSLSRDVSFSIASSDEKLTSFRRSRNTLKPCLLSGALAATRLCPLCRALVRMTLASGKSYSLVCLLLLPEHVGQTERLLAVVLDLHVVLLVESDRADGRKRPCSLPILADVQHHDGKRIIS